MALEWRLADISLLISLYKEYPVLWNVKLKEYKDRNAKELAYGKIQKVFENHTENITLEQIKKKIHTLRSQYKREIKLVRESKKSGMGADDVYNAKLWCFSQLDFLADDNLRESISTLDVDNEVS